MNSKRTDDTHDTPSSHQNNQHQHQQHSSHSSHSSLSAASASHSSLAKVAARSPLVKHVTQLKQLHRSSSYSVPIDPTVIDDIEALAKQIGDQVDGLSAKLNAALEEMSWLTLMAVDGHDNTIESLSQCILESCTKETLQLINLMDEINHDMAGVESLSLQVKGIKDSLDWLESLVK